MSKPLSNILIGVIGNAIFALCILITGYIINLSLWQTVLVIIKSISIWLLLAIYISFIALNFLIALSWNPGMLQALPQLPKNKILFILRLIFNLATPVLMLFLSFYVLMPQSKLNSELSLLFQQANILGPLTMHTYGNNGQVSHQIIINNENANSSTSNGFIKLFFRTMNSNCESACGWIVFLRRGIDLSEYKYISFLLLGQKGDEIIGVRAKDYDSISTEAQLWIEDYLPSKKIDIVWQEVKIPLSDFKKVNWQNIDNISLFTNGLRAGAREQIFFAQGFELLK